MWNILFGCYECGVYYFNKNYYVELSFDYDYRNILRVSRIMATGNYNYNLSRSNNK